MTGLFYNEYPPATSCLRSMTFGRLAGTEIAQNLGGKQGQASQHKAVPSEKRADSMMDTKRPVLIGEQKAAA
jgi:succinate dehydrogenase/fumarate reductase flavoprotein subunit